jgi:hypothetical protein
MPMQDINLPPCEDGAVRNHVIFLCQLACALHIVLKLATLWQKFEVAKSIVLVTPIVSQILTSTTTSQLTLIVIVLPCHTQTPQLILS